MMVCEIVGCDVAGYNMNARKNRFGDFLRAAVLFRMAAVLIGLFAIGHTLGFRQIDPSWGIGPIITSMTSFRFTAQGFTRTYWDFYVGFWLFVSVFLFLAALMAWRLGGLAEAEASRMRVEAWGLTMAFAAVGLLSWKYFLRCPSRFLPPFLFVYWPERCFRAPGVPPVRLHSEAGAQATSFVRRRESGRP